MKCKVCGAETMPLYVRIINFILRDKYVFENCANCRRLYSIGVPLDKIIKLRSIG